MPYFKMDSVRYNVVCAIEREAELKASDISGLLMDRTYFNDVIGTYMRYTITLAVPTGEENNYAQLYEALTDPKKDHVFDMPYNQGRKIFVGRVEAISDQYYHEEDGIHIWRNTKFTVIANEPSKVNTL